MCAAWPLAALERSGLGQTMFTQGAIVQWWTMISIVAADIAAYFGGKRWGKTKLIKVSPNKTWEGLWSGIASCSAMMVVGARLMHWPLPLLTGALYGGMCAVMGLIGDLTVSLLKRSANVKDTGDLLPGLLAPPRPRAPGSTRPSPSPTAPATDGKHGNPSL